MRVVLNGSPVAHTIRCDLCIQSSLRSISLEQRDHYHLLVGLHAFKSQMSCLNCITRRAELLHKWFISLPNYSGIEPRTDGLGG